WTGSNGLGRVAALWRTLGVPGLGGVAAFEILRHGEPVFFGWLGRIRADRVPGVSKGSKNRLHFRQGLVFLFEVGGSQSHEKILVEPRELLAKRPARPVIQ